MMRLLFLMILCQLGCAGDAQVVALEQRVTALEAEMREGWANSMCRPEVRQFLSTVRSACTGEEACSNQSLPLALLDAAPEHQGRFVSLMQSQRHEAFYLGPAGNTALSYGQTQRLRRLLQGPWLSTTQFLVFSNPGPRGRMGHPAWQQAQDQARARGRKVLQEIFDKDPVPKVLHVVLGFGLQPGETSRKEDKVPPGSNIAQSVWVFRVDC